MAAAGVAGLVAAAAATAAAVGVSASALPGDALYGFKQAREELSLRLAADDEQRVQALLQRGDARLDETARLIELGRTTEAAQTVQRFDAVVERATTTMVDTSDVAQWSPCAASHLETKLDEQHERLRRILEVAPQPAQDDLRDVLRVAALDRDLAVEPRPAAEGSEADRDEPPPTALASRPGPSRAIGDSDAGRERPSTPVPARASSAPPRQQQPATLAREHRPAEPAQADRSGEEPHAERAAESARQERSPEPTREARSAPTAGPAVTVTWLAATAATSATSEGAQQRQVQRQSGAWLGPRAAAAATVLASVRTSSTPTPRNTQSARIESSSTQRANANEPARSSADSAQRSNEPERRAVDSTPRDEPAERNDTSAGRASGAAATPRAATRAARSGGQPARTTQATDAPRR